MSPGAMMCLGLVLLLVYTVDLVPGGARGSKYRLRDSKHRASDCPPLQTAPLGLGSLGLLTATSALLCEATKLVEAPLKADDHRIYRCLAAVAHLRRAAADSKGEAPSVPYTLDSVEEGLREVIKTRRLASLHRLLPWIVTCVLLAAVILAILH